MILNKGQRVWFSDGKKSFRVREANEKFAICTQPYNFKPETVIYTIIDFWNKQIESYGLPYTMEFNGVSETLYTGEEPESEVEL